MSKTFISTTVVVVVGLFVLGGFLLWQQSAAPLQPQIEVLDTSNWQTYRNDEFGFEVKYPENIIAASRVDKKVDMIHSIPFEHPDPCDFKGGAPPLKELTDFDISIEVVDKNLREAVIARHGSYLVSNFLLDNKLKITPNFIDEASIDSLQGYRITSGVEGCGKYTYYFPLSSQNTLVVIRSFITELQPVITDYEKYLNLPGVISPDEEEKLFNQILSTFRFVEAEDETADWQTYRNDEFGYEIKYPQEWFVMSPTGNIVGDLCETDPRNEAITIFSRQSFENCGFIGEQLPPSDSDVTVWAFDNPWKDITSTLEPPVENITIAEEPAAVYRFSYQQARPNINAARVYLNHNGKGYLIFLKNQDSQGNYYDPLYDRILSTFRFIESTVPAICKDEPEGTPVITSISPAFGSIGTEIEIKGCNLAGFEADLDVTFVRSDGAQIPLYGGTWYPEYDGAESGKLMKVTIRSYCESGFAYSGHYLPCETVEATPGIYKVSVEAWGKRSNEVEFIIDTSTFGWQTYRNEKYGFEIKYPDSLMADRTGDVYEGTSPTLTGQDDSFYAYWSESRLGFQLQIQQSNLEDWVDYVEKQFELNRENSNARGLLKEKDFAGIESVQFYTEGGFEELFGNPSTGITDPSKAGRGSSYPGELRVIYFVREGYMFRIILPTQNPYVTILSTFRFVE